MAHDSKLGSKKEQDKKTQAYDLRAFTSVPGNESSFWLSSVLPTAEPSGLLTHRR